MPEKVPKFPRLEHLVGAHFHQLVNDDEFNKKFNMASYSRAIFSAIEGNKIFLEEQTTLVETINGLGTTQVYSPPADALEDGVRIARRNLIKAGNPDKVKNLSDALSQEIDRTLDYYRVAALAVAGSLLKPEWDGQFLVRICNLKKPILEIRMLKFLAEFKECDRRNLQNNNITKSAKRAMRKNLCRFEMSRQFLVKIPLEDLSKFCLHKVEDSCLAVVTLEVENTKGMKFLQRHTLTNLPELWNKWKPRGDFFQGKPSLRSPFRLVLGGDYSDMVHLVVIARSASLQAAEMYKLGESMLLEPFKTPDQTLSSHQEPVDQNKTELEPEKPKLLEITTKKEQLRREILDVLVEVDLIDKEKAEKLFKEPTNMEEDDYKRPSKVNNYLGEMGLHRCFQEYLNFRCKDVKKMKRLLSKPLKADDYEIQKEAFCFDEDDEKSNSDLNINTMTALELLKLQKERPTAHIRAFFSFCWQCVADDENTSHCDRCHACKMWREWHCLNCDHCTFSDSRLQCMHCGDHGDGDNVEEPGVKPALEKRCLIKDKLLMYEQDLEFWGFDGESSGDDIWEKDSDSEDSEDDLQLQQDDTDDDSDEEEGNTNNKLTDKPESHATTGTEKEDAADTGKKSGSTTSKEHSEEPQPMELGSQQSSARGQSADDASGSKTAPLGGAAAAESDLPDPATGKKEPEDSAHSKPTANVAHGSQAASSGDVDPQNECDCSSSSDESEPGNDGEHRERKQHNYAYYMKRGWHFSDDEDDVFQSPVSV